MAIRVSVALFVLLAQVLPAVARPSAPSPAQQLGRAYEAYDKGDLAGAKALLGKLPDGKILNRDYLAWLRGMVALRLGEPAVAKRAFEQLGKLSGSRFSREVPWRLADAAWLAGDRATAARAYAKLAAAAGAGQVGDAGTALYRVAETRTGVARTAAMRAFVLDYPSHPLARQAEQELATPLTPPERLERAKRLTVAHLWDEAVAELALVEPTGDLVRLRDYWLGITLFKMRRRYGDAGKLLLGVYPTMGSSADEALFHGARALSRADRDDEAIQWYRKVVALYPTSKWAAGRST